MEAVDEKQKNVLTATRTKKRRQETTSPPELVEQIESVSDEHPG